MLGELFAAFCRVPYLRKTLWGSWYEFRARNYRERDWTFMNYGFHDDFDAAVNVESSHSYPDLAQFFREACRMLKHGGHFL